MPTETEELLLRVSVVDDGSVAKIKEIQDALGKLPGNIKPIRMEAEGLFETLKKGFEAINQGPEAIGKFVTSMAPALAGLGEMALSITAVTGAVVLAVKEMNEFAQEMVELGNIAKQTGIAVGDVQEILEQFAAQGIQNGTQALQGLAASMENLSRVNSSLYRSLLVSAGQFKPAMQGFLESLSTADSAEQRINRIWQAAQNVQRNTFAEMRRAGWSEDAAREAAAERAARFGAALGQPDILKMRHPLEEPTAEEKENRAARLQAMQEYYETTTKLGQAWANIKDSVLGIITPVATEVLKGLLSAFQEVAHVLSVVEHAIRAAWNAIPDVLKRAVAGAAQGAWAGPFSMIAGGVRGAIQSGDEHGKPAPGGVEHGVAIIHGSPHGLGAPPPGTPVFGSRQHGGAITETGPYTLHAGEMVSSAGETSSVMRQLTASIRELNTTMRSLLGLGGAGAGGGGSSSGGSSSGGARVAGPQYMSAGGALGFGGTSGAGGGGGGGGSGFSGGGGQFGGGGATGSWGDQGGGGGGEQGAGAGAGGLAGNVKVGEIETKGNQVNPQSLYRNLVGAFRGSSLSGYVPPDGAKYGIKTGSPEEWARLATALASQESGFQVKSHETGFGGHLAGVFQFGAVDLQRRGLGSDVGNVGNQVKAMVGEFEKMKKEGGIERGGSHYFGPFRRPHEVLKHMDEASRIATRAGAVPDTGDTSQTPASTQPSVTAEHPVGKSAESQTETPQAQPDTGSGTAGIPHSVLDAAQQVAISTGGNANAVQQFMASQGIHRYGNWCGEFTAAVVKKAGLQPPPGYAVASNWRKWGVADTGPRVGDVAVRKGTPTGSTGSHVGIVTGVHGNQITLEGGNQGPIKITQSAARYDYRTPPGGAGVSGAPGDVAGGGGDTGGTSGSAGDARGGGGGGGPMFGGGGMPSFGGFGRQGPLGGILGGLMGRLPFGMGGMLGMLMGGHGGAGLGGLLGGSMGGGFGGMLNEGRSLLGALDRGGLDRILGGELRHRVDGQARVHVAVDDQRVNVRAPRPSGLFRDAVVQRQAQMIPASPGPAATPSVPGGMASGGTFG